MILLCGIPSESPLALVAEALATLGAPFLILNQRHVAEWDIALEINDDGIAGWLHLGGRAHSLADITGVYVRLMDYRELPEFKAATPDSAFREICRIRHDTLLSWIEFAPGRILNRAAAMAGNFSKPYQAQLIADAGFDVPPTLVTNDPSLALAFRDAHSRIIYKSISSARSIVREFTDSDALRLEHIRWCPVQFQAYIPGYNVRVHVAGDSIFATEIVSEAADYRYAQRESGVAAVLRAMELDPELRERCHTLAHRLDLPLSGIDLKFTPDGRIYCFEVNPSPAFSYYETHTCQPISHAIAEFLASSGDSTPSVKIAVSTLMSPSA